MQLIIDRFLRGSGKKAINQKTVTGLVDGLETGSKGHSTF
jgi:hypothetical protein